MTFPHHIIGLLKKSSGWTLCPEYEAVYNAYITKPSDPDAEVDNTMVLGWVNDGVWVKKDGIWVFANHAAGADSLRNWKDPSGTLATAYNSPAHGIWEGYTGNGSNAYIDLNWNPAVHGVNYQLNSASLGIYIRNNVNESRYDFGVVDASNWILLASRYSDKYYVGINTAYKTDSDTNTDSRGMFIANRTASNVNDGYKNKVQIVNGSDVSNGIPNNNIFVLCHNNNGSPEAIGTKQASIVFTGAGLTQTDINNITDRFQTRMTYHGTQV